MAKLLEITGKAISGEWGQDDDTGTGIPVLRTTNFTNEGFVNYKNVVTRSISKKNIAEKYLRHGDIIIEKSGGSDKQPVGRVIFFEGEENKYLFNNFTGLLRVQNPEEWLPKYVFYALYAYYRNGGTRAFENRTTGLHNLQVDNYVKSVDIPKLSYRKQQHICETLDHVRDAVAYRERQLTKLDELVKARFVEMFGEPGAKNENWPQCTLGKACKINPKKSEDIRLQPNLEVSFVPMPAVTENGKMDSSIIKIYDEVKTGFTYFSERDVLFAKITPCMENGKGAVAVNLKNEIGFGSTEFHVIRPIAEKTNPYWIYALTVFEKFRKDAAKNMTGSAGQRRVPASFLENYQISLPPIDLQNQFAAFVAEVDKSKLLAELFAQNACILAENRSK